MRFPSGFASLTNLVRFFLINCNKCQHLPPLDQFHSLKLLYLNKLDSLEYISERDNSREFSDSSFLPSLEEPALYNCPNPRGWWPRESSTFDFMAENHLRPLFPLLFKVCIRECHKLTSMPLFPPLENLELHYCSFKPMGQKTRIAKVASSLYQ